MKEAKRVIKRTGIIFLNLGDSFYSKSGSGQGNGFIELCPKIDKNGVILRVNKEVKGKFKTNWLQHKQKLLIPYRIAIRCQDELGLVLRNDIHWVKQFVNVKTNESYGSSMPSPVQDRFNTNSESIFFFVKDKNYFFDLDSIRIPHKVNSLRRCEYPHKSSEGSPYSKQCDGKNMRRFCNPKGKNPGDCLHFPFEPRNKEHFATFPSTIPELLIKCGCPKNGIVLDPFIGSGTTAISALKLGRKFIGFDLNNDYCKLAELNIKRSLNG